MTLPELEYETPRRKRRILSGLALSAGLLVSAFGQAQPLAAAGTLTVAQQQDPQNLDPIDTFMLTWGSIASNIFDALLVRDEALNLGPALATSWEYLDNDTRVRFKLREGVTFHNGEPFTAEAVKYTFDRLLGDEGAKGPQRSNYTSIASVEVVDDYTVDFVLAQPDPVLLTKLSGYGAMIVPPKYTEEVGEEAFNLKPMGTGPFKIDTYTPSVELKLVRNDEYWNGTAKVDELVIRFIPEPSTRMAELLSGGVDIALNIPTTAIDTIEKNPDVELRGVPGPTVWMLRFRFHDAMTEDVRVRKAINMAIDRQAIIDALLKGYGSPISSIQGSKSFGNDPELQGYPYDPEQAKALLKEAGIAPGTEITFDMRNNDDAFKEVAQVISSYLEAVGLKVKLRLHEQGVYFSELIPQGQTGEIYQMSWGGWTFDFDNTAYLLYHSGERWTPFFKDEKLDALLEKQRQTYDTDVREKTLQEVAGYAHENALDVPLVNFETLYGVSKRVEGFVPAPDDRARYMSVSIK